MNEAESEYNELLKLVSLFTTPGSMKAWDIWPWLADLYEKEGKIQAADMLYRKTIADCSGSGAPARQRYARFLQRQGNHEKANAMIERVKESREKDGTWRSDENRLVQANRRGWLAFLGNWWMCTNKKVSIKNLLLRSRSFEILILIRAIRKVVASDC